MSAGTKLHQRYKTSSGKVCPGVTTLIGGQLGWNGAVLQAWTRKCCMNGDDPTLISKDAADSGTAGHLLIECYIKGTEPDLSAFTESQISRGRVAFEAFKGWNSKQSFKFVHTELSVVSELFEYGGSIDLIAQDGDDLVLIDIKTSKSVYPEHILQLAAYSTAFREQEGKCITSYHILQLSKTGGGYSDHIISPAKISVAWQAFLCCRKLYDLQKLIKD